MLELGLGIVGSILAIALILLKVWENSKKKTVLEKIGEAKSELDTYIAHGRYDQAAHMASDALDRIDLILRQRGKSPPK